MHVCDVYMYEFMYVPPCWILKFLHVP